jgi:hypothetical protein
MQTNIVKVIEKNVYGTPKLYPFNEEAQLFTQFLQRTTLTLRDITYIKKLGFKVIQVMYNGDIYVQVKEL